MRIAPNVSASYDAEMSQPFELTFMNVIGVYNALWDLGGQLAMNPAVGDHDSWLLTFRCGLRGMLARIRAVDHHYVLLHNYEDDPKTAKGNPNEWAVECEYHAGVILFGMDSSLECLVFALNALGFAKSPNDFCNITNPRSLKQINPRNILGGEPADKLNPRPGYQRYFPRVVAHWRKSEGLLSTIFEYHDVTKHRSAIVQGGVPGKLRMRENPKQPGSLGSSSVHTLESLAHGYQQFVDELLPLALEEGAAAFGYRTMRKEAGE